MDGKKCIGNIHCDGNDIFDKTKTSKNNFPNFCFQTSTQFKRFRNLRPKTYKTSIFINSFENHYPIVHENIAKNKFDPTVELKIITRFSCAKKCLELSSALGFMYQSNGPKYLSSCFIKEIVILRALRL